MYALCKHGPACNLQKQGRCWFAHSLSEVEYPSGQALHARRWCDESHVAAGRTGIDYFFGQEYSQTQHERIMSYVAFEEEGEGKFPLWCVMYLWFTKHRLYRLCAESDFGWYSSVISIPQEMMLPSHAHVLYRDPQQLCVHWDPPFVYARDHEGKTFAQRMAARLLHSRSFCVLEAKRDWDDWYEKSFGVFAGRLRALECSTSYFRMHRGEKFILLSRAIGIWAWVVRYDAPDEGGWTIEPFLELTDEQVFLEHWPSYMPDPNPWLGMGMNRSTF